jgi:hypothetical protein
MCCGLVGGDFGDDIGELDLGLPGAAIHSAFDVDHAMYCFGRSTSERAIISAQFRAAGLMNKNLEKC